MLKDLIKYEIIGKAKEKKEGGQKINKKEFLLSIAYISITFSLYLYLVSVLKWTDLLTAIVSCLFFITITINIFWNIGFGYTFLRKSLLPFYYRHREKKNAITHTTRNEYPTVSILIPSYKEPIEFIQKMIEHFTKIDYPKYKICLYICDDTPDPLHRYKVKELVNSTYQDISKGKNYNISINNKHSNNHNIFYVSRDIRKGFKAGAINSILSKIDTEYIICLDIDHLPQKYMVKDIVDEIQKIKKPFLMFPQYFRNENDNNISKTTALQQKVDYHFDRFGRCVTNSAFCVTTNWIAKTEALKQVGGLNEDTVTEDLATGIVIHANKHHIDIADKALAFGLTPNTLHSWRKQQYRWAFGSFHVAKSVFKKYWSMLSASQLFDYLQCITWYLVGPLAFLMYIFPILSILGLPFLTITDRIPFTLRPQSLLHLVGFHQIFQQ